MMDIHNNFSPVFCAKFQNIVKISKLAEGSNKYADETASFVKIEPNNIDDINALKNIAKCWKDASFATNIYYAASAIRNDSKFYKNHMVFALTSQKSDFEKLDDDKILGIIHIAPLNKFWLFIEQLQANPKYIYKKDSLYKGIGTGILNSVKGMCSKMSCFPAESESVKKFYAKNGFNEEDKLSNFYVWYRDIMDTLFNFKP